jgi:hypothetical protein
VDGLVVAHGRDADASLSKLRRIRLTLLLQNVVVRDDQRVRQPAELLDRGAERERGAPLVALVALQVEHPLH